MRPTTRSSSGFESRPVSWRQYRKRAIVFGPLYVAIGCAVLFLLRFFFSEIYESHQSQMIEKEEFIRWPMSLGVMTDAQLQAISMNYSGSGLPRELFMIRWFEIVGMFCMVSGTLWFLIAPFSLMIGRNMPRWGCRGSCANCAYPLHRRDEYCAQCGIQVGCAQCHYPLSPTAVCCPECGVSAQPNRFVNPSGAART